MKMLKNKTKISAITFVLTLTISAILIALPTVTAHDPPWTVPTWAYISVTNNPIGVGQQTVVVFWPNKIPPTAFGPYGDRWTWNLEVTKPDGSEETLGPITSDPVGGGWTSYTPDQVGTYTFVAKMDDHVITGEPYSPGWGPSSFGFSDVGDTYLGDTSDPYELTVQEEPIEAWEEAPLPTEYWERPINTMSRNWYVLAGNWLAGAAQNVGPTSRFNYGTGPESAHIMWSTPFWAGGIMDARFGNTGYQTAHYDGLDFDPPIILNGKIYYNTYGQPKIGWNCLDLYTGELEYFHNTTGPVIVGSSGSDIYDPSPYSLRSDSSGAILGGWLQFGQVLNYESPNQHGGYPYLIGRGPNGETDTWQLFDAFTGNYLYSIANVSAPRGSVNVYGKDGSILYYNIVNGRLTVWNSTKATEEGYSGMRNYYWCWRPFLNHTFDGNNGFALNVSIPDVSGSIRAVREGEFLIGGTGGTNKPDVPLELGNLWCLSLEPGQEGTLLWNRTFTPPYDEVPSTVALTFGAGGVVLGTVDPEDGVFLFSSSITREWWCYSLETGEMLWGPSEPEASMNYYGMGTNIYQGKLLSTGYSGELIAYNITTGEVLWVYTARQEGYESPYGNYPIGIACIADGKVYLTSSEHSPTQPLWRGSRIRCIDVSNGEELWTINHWGAGMGSGSGIVIADGYIVGLNFYDNQLYCYGKGPSATEVTAAPKIVEKGSSVMIEGTVTDQSSGAKSREVMAKSPNEEGIPCISDEYMTEWMEYLYMDQGIPGDATGVEVTLDAIDPNGNFVHIDTVRSDMSGMFKKKWTPEHEGEYTIIATFEGSKSYWASYAETTVGVDPAAAPSGPIEPEPTEPTAEAPFITTEVAILLAAVIVAVAVIVGFWFIRKRK
jgi:hypothetical protein